MSLLVFFIVYHLVPGGTKFIKQDHSLRFAWGVTDEFARKYIFKHHGERELNSEGEIISPSFAEIVSVQTAGSSPEYREISLDKVLETLKK